MPPLEIAGGAKKQTGGGAVSAPFARLPRQARKPSSVPRSRSPGGWSSVWDGCRQPPRAAYPRLAGSHDPVGGVGHTSPLIWPCSDWGLPCHRCYQRCGGLLPHRFTLAVPLGLRPGSRRSLLCGPVRRLAAPRRYLAVYPLELGLSSSLGRSKLQPGPATIRPACAP